MLKQPKNPVIGLTDHSNLLSKSLYQFFCSEVNLCNPLSKPVLGRYQKKLYWNKYPHII